MIRQRITDKKQLRKLSYGGITGIDKGNTNEIKIMLVKSGRLLSTVGEVVTN